METSPIDVSPYSFVAACRIDVSPYSFLARASPFAAVRIVSNTCLLRPSAMATLTAVETLFFVLLLLLLLLFFFSCGNH